MREKIINGKESLPQDLVEMFDERAIKMKDEDYDKLGCFFSTKTKLA